MQVEATTLPGVLLLTPEPRSDERGLFTRTFDPAIGRVHGIELGELVQDSQSRSWQGVLRGMHGRGGRGEAKLVRCAHGRILDVVVDARPGSATFGQRESFTLDDGKFQSLYIPAGMLHGFQATSDVADVCYRIDTPHDPSQDIAVRFDDPDLDIAWPLPVTALSPRDAAAGSWAELLRSLES